MAHMDRFFVSLFVGLFCSSSALTLQYPQIDPSFHGHLPIEYVHVPKAGTSFLKTLISIPGACRNVPKDFGINELTVAMEPEALATVPSAVKPPWTCNQSVLDTDPHRLWHWGIESKASTSFAAAKGRYIIFLRQPEQRITSHFLFDTNPYYDRRMYLSLETYLRRFSGCATKLLMRSEPDYACGLAPPTPAEVEEAQRRLRTGFFFVGLTEQWHLSICLFNRMFNQKCRSIQFDNVRPTVGKRGVEYDTRFLRGWRDPYDHGLYDAGVEIFNRNLATYNVSESSCMPCWQEAGVSPPLSQLLQE